MLTYAEQERLAFIKGDPCGELLAECADMEAEIDKHPDELQDQFELGEAAGAGEYAKLFVELQQLKEKHETACNLLQSMQKSITQFLEK